METYCISRWCISICAKVSGRKCDGVLITYVGMGSSVLSPVVSAGLQVRATGVMKTAPRCHHKGVVAPLYMGLASIAPIHSGKSTFPWQYTFNPESVFTKGYLWSKYGGPKNYQNWTTGKLVKVHFHNSSSSHHCHFCFSFNTCIG